MSIRVELQLEIEPIMPETRNSLAEEFPSIIKDVVRESGLSAEEVTHETTFGQNLPVLDPGAIEHLVAAIVLVGEQGPKVLRGIHSAVDGLFRRVTGEKGSRASGKISVNGCEVAFTDIPYDALPDVLAAGVKAMEASMNRNSGE